MHSGSSIYGISYAFPQSLLQDDEDDSVDAATIYCMPNIY